jgi:preprotein translocase subunit YajC
MPRDGLRTARRAYNRRFARRPVGAFTASQETPKVFISNAYAQAAGGATGGGGLLSLLPIVLMFVVLWFIMIRPQMKRQKEHKAMIDASGLIGKITKLGETYVTIELAANVEVQCQRSSILQVLPKGTIK